jgi:Trk K+ transport system NAD-binding subunit
MIPVMPGSRAIGKTCRDLRIAERYNVHVIAYWRSGTFVAEPPVGECVDATTMLYVFGRSDAVETLISDEFSVDDEGMATAIVAGFGDVGKAAFKELSRAGIDCVVVDRKKQTETGIVGNAEDDAVLLDARIDEAEICVVALNDDHVNIFATLMARNMNPSIRILARANEPASVDRLYRAGADYVALLPAIGGQVIAGLVLSDMVTVMLDLPDRRKVIARRLTKNTPAAVGEIEHATGVQVLGIERSDGPLVLPSRAERIGREDMVIVIGENKRLRRFIERY